MSRSSAFFDGRRKMWGRLISGPNLSGRPALRQQRVEPVGNIIAVLVVEMAVPVERERHRRKED
jgi:hypothetical protein